MLFKIIFKKYEDTTLDLQNLSSSCDILGFISVYIHFFFFQGGFLVMQIPCKKLLILLYSGKMICDIHFLCLTYFLRTSQKIVDFTLFGKDDL